MHDRHIGGQQSCSKWAAPVKHGSYGLKALRTKKVLLLEPESQTVR
jgi:hypothetical protein